MKLAVKNLVSLSKLASLTLLFLVAQSALAAQETFVTGGRLEAMGGTG